MQNHFQSWHKVASIASIDITLMSLLLQYLDTVLSTLCTWRVRSSHPKEFYKKGVFKSSIKFTGKHLRRGPFCNKAVDWRPATSLNTESGVGTFLWILRNFYFENVCEGMPLKSKIFTGFCFCKILGFYYKRNRQLFYYEGTSSCMPLKIPERVNKVIFQNFSQLLLLNIHQQTKTFQSRQRNVSGMLFRCF